MWHQVLPRDGDPFKRKGHLLDDTLPVGTDYVEAVYAASGNSRLDLGCGVQKVNKASTSLVLSASPNPSHFGQAVSLSAQTTPGTGPTGTVTFYQDSPPNGYEIDTATLNASGQATLVPRPFRRGPTRSTPPTRAMPTTAPASRTRSP